LGCVYIPPENSLYSSINAFLDIENELVNIIEKDMKCALVGDFNPKTAVFPMMTILFKYSQSRLAHF
jgi:hypothetical protein